jgi:heme/copper-type cytochrome/quinol oxidase subunit 3
MKILRFSLTVILLIYSVPAFLSGLDIYKGKESDLSAEWIIVCVFFALSLVYILVNAIEWMKLKK